MRRTGYSCESVPRNSRVIGARMMGGGFGGCTINLVEEAYLESFQDQIVTKYRAEMGSKIKIYKTKISGGSHVIDQ